MEDYVISDSLKEKLSKAENLEEVAQACIEEGLAVTVDDLKAVEASQKDELNEEDLDNVAGGAAPVLTGAVIAAYLIWKAIRGNRGSSGRGHGGGGRRF